jgi:DNA-binding CsgD family transcriptional regulator
MQGAREHGHAGTTESRLLELVGEVIGVLELDELRLTMLRALRRSLPARWASMNEIAPDEVVSLVEPELDPVWNDRFAGLAHENPLYIRWSRTRDGRPYRFSDVTTREQLEATALYRQVYAPLGIRHQIAFTLPGEPDRVIALALHREDRDFSDGERDFLARARPYLIQAYRNALALSEAEQGSPALLVTALGRAGLTKREAEVVRLIALGQSNADAAARLGLSDRTVQKHLERAFPKLGVTTRSQAAQRAWKLAGAEPES